MHTHLSDAVSTQQSAAAPSDGVHPRVTPVVAPSPTRRFAPLNLDIRFTTLQITQDEYDSLVDELPTRARYQREYLQGVAKVSGSDLRGSAREYGGSYHRSRKTVERFVENAGIRLVAVTGRSGARSLWSLDALLEHFEHEARPASH